MKRRFIARVVTGDGELSSIVYGGLPGNGRSEILYSWAVLSWDTMLRDQMSIADPFANGFGTQIEQSTTTLEFQRSG